MRKKLTVIMILVIINITYVNASADIFYYDVYQHWAFDQIYKVTNEYELFDGYEDSTFRPDQNITRGEFVKILYKIAQTNGILENVDPATLAFTDFSMNHWSYTYVEYFNEYLNENPIKKVDIYAVLGKKFQPDRYITREEAAALAASMCAPSPEKKVLTFSDVTKDYRYYNEILKLYSNGIISGYPDNTFRGKNNITRAEAAVIAGKLQKEIDMYKIDNFSSILLHQDIEGFSLFGEYIDENDDDSNYYKAVSSLEYITFVGYIFPGDSYLYDSSPIRIFRQLKEGGYKNSIGVNYYLLRYDNDMTEKQKTDICNEILYELEKSPDKLSDNDFLKILNEITGHNVEYELFKKVVTESISLDKDVYTVSDVMYNYWKYIFENRKFDDIANEVDYFMKNRVLPKQIVNSTFMKEAGYAVNLGDRDTAGLYYVNMTNFAKLMFEIGLKSESAEILKSTYNVLQTNNNYKTVFERKKNELTGNIKYVSIN